LVCCGATSQPFTDGHDTRRAQWLTLIVSRLRRVCQRDRGMSDSVRSPSDNCSGVTKMSTGSGAPICSISSISANQLDLTDPPGDIPMLSETPCTV